MIVIILTSFLLFTGLSQSQNQQLDSKLVDNASPLQGNAKNLQQNSVAAPIPIATSNNLPTEADSIELSTPIPIVTEIPSKPKITGREWNENLIPIPALNFTGCPDGKDCVQVIHCKDSVIIKDGTALIDIRIDNDAPKQCQGLETCCAIDDKVETLLLKPLDVPPGCGYRNPNGIGIKITGDKDNEAQYGEFPWVVAIIQIDQIPSSQNLKSTPTKCGGSLIHPSVVLTAAHCINGMDSKRFAVRAGEWDTQTTAELYPHHDRNVVDFIVHEGYNEATLYNDIALLFVDRPFKIDENVKTICLPPADLNFDHSRCYATGWGKDSFSDDAKYQSILKKIDLPIVPWDKCQNDLRHTRLGSFFNLDESFICAGGEKGKDACIGDGGGPLVCPIPGPRKPGEPERFYQVGIVAWGIGCGDPIPGVYASLAKLRPWIDEKLAHRQIEYSSFTPE